MWMEFVHSSRDSHYFPSVKSTVCFLHIRYTYTVGTELLTEVGAFKLITFQKVLYVPASSLSPHPNYRSLWAIVAHRKCQKIWFSELLLHMEVFALLFFTAEYFLFSRSWRMMSDNPMKSSFRMACLFYLKISDSTIFYPVNSKAP